jgi:DNA-binding transcriptional LysR family regulator
VIDWDDIRVCLAVHRARTFAQAGALLGLNATTVARRLSALEETLGSKLFERRPEGCVPTEVCLRLVERAERMEQEMLALSRDLAGSDQSLEGKVRITATEMMATRFIAPHLGRFRERHPTLELELVCTSERLDLSRREADISLRLSRPEEDQLVIKRLASVNLGLYAARKYIDSHGMPESFAGHHAIFFADVRGFARENAWLENTLKGARVSLRSDSVSSVYGACVASAGIALLPRIVADRDGRLLRIGEEGPEPRFIWQAVHQDLAQTARIRAVSAYLAEIFEPPA